MTLHRLIVALVVLACSPGLHLLPGASARAESNSDALEEARRRVFEFERPLVEQIFQQKDRDDLLESDKFQDTVRAFFAGLDNRETKIAAIEMLHSRYVYVVNKTLAAELLGPFLRDRDQDVRIQAAQAVGYNRCGARYAEDLIGMLADDPSANVLTSVAYAMSGSGHQPFASHLIALLRHPDANVRSTASNALTRLAPKAAFEHIVPLLNDEQASVRFAAVQHMTWMQDQRTIALIEQRLDDEDHSVRERAVWALGQMKNSGSADVIAELLGDSHHHVRGRVALVLGSLQATKYAGAVAGLLDDYDVVVRRYATQALGEMGEQRYKNRLSLLLNDSDAQIRKDAAESIQQLSTTATHEEQ